MPRGKQTQKPQDDVVTMPLSELKSLMQTIATKVFDTKKVELREEIEDECEYKVYIQSAEIEQTFEKLEEQLKSRAETIDFKKIVQEHCTKTLAAEMKSTKEEIDALKIQNSKMKRQLEKLQFSLACKNAKIEDLKMKVDRTKQNIVWWI